MPKTAAPLLGGHPCILEGAVWLTVRNTTWEHLLNKMHRCSIDPSPHASVADEEDPQDPPPEEGAAEDAAADGDEGEFGEDSEQAGQLGGDITDISNSAAVKYLEKLVQTGQLTEPRCHGPSQSALRRRVGQARRSAALSLTLHDPFPGAPGSPTPLLTAATLRPIGWTD